MKDQSNFKNTFLNNLRKSFLLFLIFIPSLVLAGELNFKHAYLAVSGPTNGPGVLGHSFLLFSKKPWVFLDGLSYQYAIDFNKLPESLTSGDMGVDDMAMLASEINNLPIAVTKDPAYNFINKYQRENRAVEVFKLKLNHKEVQALHERVKIDFKKFNVNVELRDESFNSRYNIIKSNCSTLLLRRISDVLSTETMGREFLDTLWDNDGNFEWSKLSSTQNVLNTIPLFWTTLLRKSEMVEQHQVFKPNNFIQMEKYLVFADSLKKSMMSCGKSEAFINSYLKAFSSERLRANYGFLKKHASILSSCENSISRKEYEDIVAASVVYTEEPLPFINLL